MVKTHGIVETGDPPTQTFIVQVDPNKPSPMMDALDAPGIPKLGHKIQCTLKQVTVITKDGLATVTCQYEPEP
jgi:hypothetical protein